MVFISPLLPEDILLNVFLAIAVDNLADAVNMTKIDEEEKKKKKDAKLMKKLAWKTKMDSLDSDGYETIWSLLTVAPSLRTVFILVFIDEFLYELQKNS